MWACEEWVLQAHSSRGHGGGMKIGVAETTG